MTATETTALAPRRASEIAVEGEWSVQRIVEQTKKIQECMQAVMKRDEHYGVIPGTGTKPTLLKAGAEKLCLMFRFDPEYEVVTSSETPALFAYTIRCILWHIPTGVRVASGLGACNSREEKYQRAAPKKCPQCGREAIIKGKQEYGGGWLCFQKKNGCGAKFIDGAEEIEKQDNGVKDPSDLSNTILKMACKRALVAAVLNGTAASDCFTQDLEDLTEKAAEYIPPKASADPKAQAGAQDVAPAQSSAAATAPTPTKSRSNGTGGGAIKHDGTQASAAQVRMLHALKTKLGMQECDGKCARETVKVTKTKGQVPITVRCVYHAQLAKFEDQQGKPVTTSKDLSISQMRNLIDRYQAQADKNQEKTDNLPDVDLGAVMEREPGSDDEEMADPGDLADLEEACFKRWGGGFQKQFPGWLKDAFDYSTVMELRKQEAIDAAQMIREGR